MTDAMAREKMEAPKKTWTGLRRLRSCMDAQGSRNVAKPRDHCDTGREYLTILCVTKGAPGHPTPRAAPTSHTELPECGVCSPDTNNVS